MERHSEPLGEFVTNRIVARSTPRNVRRAYHVNGTVSETVITIRRVALILAVMAIGYFTVIGILASAVSHGWTA